MTDDGLLEVARLYRKVEARVTAGQTGDLFKPEQETDHGQDDSQTT